MQAKPTQSALVALLVSVGEPVAVILPLCYSARAR